MKHKHLSDKSPLSTSISQLFRSMRRHKDHGNKPHRSGRYMYLLKLITKNNGPKTSELAQLMDIRPSSLSEMLSNLEKDGFIERRKDPNDLRILRVYLTERGETYLCNFKDNEVDITKNILTKDEEATFIELCNKLSEGIIANREHLKE